MVELKAHDFFLLLMCITIKKFIGTTYYTILEYTYSVIYLPFISNINQNFIHTRKINIKEV